MAISHATLGGFAIAPTKVSAVADSEAHSCLKHRAQAELRRAASNACSANTLDHKWHVITEACFEDDKCGALRLTSRQDLDRGRPRWRQETAPPRELTVLDAASS